MQNELEAMKTSHGARMGLPTFVRHVAAMHVQKNREGKVKITPIPDQHIKSEDKVGNS